MTNPVITLDLCVNPIWVFESFKVADSVRKILDLVISGMELPPIPIYALGRNEYSLNMAIRIDFHSSSMADGGHKRAIAHYLLQRPIKCEVYPVGFNGDLIPFREITIFDKDKLYSLDTFAELLRSEGKLKGVRSLDLFEG